MSDENDDLFGTYSTTAADSDNSGASRKSGANFLKLVTGDNVLRILPPPRGAASVLAARWSHPLKGGQERAYRSINCGRMANGAACPVCEYMESLMAAEGADNRERVKEMEPQYSALFAALDLGPDGQKPVDPKNILASIVVVEVRKTVVQGLTEIRKNGVTGGDYSHPLTGFPIVIKKLDTPAGVRYNVVSARDLRAPAVPQEYLKDLAAVLPDVRKFAEAPTPEEASASLDEYIADYEVAQAAAARSSGRKGAAARR